MRRSTILFLLLLTVPLFAQVQYSVTPARGPVAGGNEVILKGSFGGPYYSVYFGHALAPAELVDRSTLRITAPPHLPGPAELTLFEVDVLLPTGVTYTYEGRPEAAFEPLLLPVFVPPTRGAFGSEFRTDFRARLVKEPSALLYGLRLQCCPTLPPETAHELEPYRPELEPEDFVPSGTPGALVYVSKEEARRVVLNLRAYDTSRSAENFGTEIPIVPASAFAKGWDGITLIGIPSDPRFRNTLRIYGYGDGATQLTVTIEGENGLVVEHEVDLPSQPDLFHPGYVELTSFPADAGMLRVSIAPVVPPISAPIPPPDRWAFISVTNNETQHITLITPQPKP